MVENSDHWIVRIKHDLNGGHNCWLFSCHLILLGLLGKVWWFELIRHWFSFFTTCNWLDKRPKDLLPTPSKHLAIKLISMKALKSREICSKFAQNFGENYYEIGKKSLFILQNFTSQTLLLKFTHLTHVQTWTRLVQVSCWVC